jgi:hypothetical protein
LLVFDGGFIVVSFPAELVMFVAYGIEALPENDPYVALAGEAMHTLSIASTPGKFLVVSSSGVPKQAYLKHNG